MVIKFSVGHSGRWQFTVVKGEDIKWCYSSQFNAMRKEYLKNAPPGSNTANVKGFRRIRDGALVHSFKKVNTWFGGPWLPTKINQGHEEWLEHPNFPNGNLVYLYGDAKRGERFFSGKSTRDDFRVR